MNKSWATVEPNHSVSKVVEPFSRKLRYPDTAEPHGWTGTLKQINI
jgi:hypothetical protein